MNHPEFLYHYTSLETLALILNNRTLCFNNLLYVDDIEEAESKDMGRFGKYINVSCWTDDAEEKIALWNLYTPNMHGIRIKLPVFPFKKYHFRTGEYHLTQDVDTYIDMEKLYREDTGAIVWYESSDCEYLLHTPEHKHFDYRNYRDSYWMPIMENIGFDHLPHDTRHTCISLLTEAHVDPTMIKKIVGHSGAMSPTERVYTELDIRVLVEAINSIKEKKE